MSLDIDDDFDLFDDTEIITLSRRNSQGVVTTTTSGVKALRRAASSIVIPGANITATRWHLKANTITPVKGDRIISARFGTWEIINIATETLVNRYACDCKKISD